MAASKSPAVFTVKAPNPTMGAVRYADMLWPTPCIVLPMPLRLFERLAISLSKMPVSIPRTTRRLPITAEAMNYPFTSF
ncbi:hypothetical protein D3C87_2055710 [compost metagenome]